MKKKLISCILVSTMAIGLLAGCGSGEKKSSEVSSGEDENTLTVWA